MLAGGNFTPWASKKVVGVEANGVFGGNSCGAGGRSEVPLNAVHLSSVTCMTDPLVLSTVLPTDPPIPLVTGRVTAPITVPFTPPNIVDCGVPPVKVSVIV